MTTGVAFLAPLPRRWHAAAAHAAVIEPWSAMDAMQRVTAVGWLVGWLVSYLL